MVVVNLRLVTTNVPLRYNSTNRMMPTTRVEARQLTSSTPWTSSLYSQYRPPTTTLPITHNDYSYTQHLTDDILSHGSDDTLSRRSSNVDTMLVYGNHRFDQMEVSEPDAPPSIANQRPWTPT